MISRRKCNYNYVVEEEQSPLRLEFHINNYIKNRLYAIKTET